MTRNRFAPWQTDIGYTWCPALPAVNRDLFPHKRSALKCLLSLQEVMPKFDIEIGLETKLKFYIERRPDIFSKSIVLLIV